MAKRDAPKRGKKLGKYQLCDCGSQMKIIDRDSSAVVLECPRCSKKTTLFYEE